MKDSRGLSAGSGMPMRLPRMASVIGKMIDLD